METQLTEKGKYEFCMEALHRKANLERDYLELGRMLYLIKEKALFEGHWDSWDVFAMELKMSQSAISRIMRIYATFQLRFKFSARMLVDAGGWTVLADLLPSIDEDTTRERVEDLLRLATDQSRTDLGRTLKEGKTGISMTHKHTEEPYYLKVYTCCGLRERVEKP